MEQAYLGKVEAADGYRDAWLDVKAAAVALAAADPGGLAAAREAYNGAVDRIAAASRLCAEVGVDVGAIADEMWRAHQ